MVTRRLCRRQFTTSGGVVAHRGLVTACGALHFTFGSVIVPLPVRLIILAVAFRKSPRADALDQDLSAGGGFLSGAIVSMTNSASGMALGSLA